MVRVYRLLLGTGALGALVLALAILLVTDAFYASYGIAPGSNLALLSELKAPAGALLLAAIVMGLGLFDTRWHDRAMLAGALLYLGFGLGRVLALAIDGLPPASLLLAMAVELLLGLGFAIALSRQARG